jgi:hypothetical protein
LAVGVSDLPGIKVLTVALTVGGRRVIVVMGVEKVNPQKKRTLGLFKPRENLVNGLLGTTLDVSGVSPFQLSQVKLVIIEVETVVQAPTPVEYEGAYKRTGLVSLVFQNPGQ